MDPPPAEQIEGLQALARSLHASAHLSGLTRKYERDLGLLLNALDSAATYFEECEDSMTTEVRKRLMLFKAILSDLAKLQKGCCDDNVDKQVSEDISALISDIIFGLTVMNAEMMMSSQNSVNRLLQKYIVDLCTGQRKADAITTVFDRNVPAKRAWEELQVELESIGISRTQSMRERDMIIMTLYKAATEERLLKKIVFKQAPAAEHAQSPAAVDSSQADRMSFSSTSSPSRMPSIHEASTEEFIHIPVAVELKDLDTNVQHTVPLEQFPPGDKTSFMELAELTFNVFDKRLFDDFSPVSSRAPSRSSLSDISPTSPVSPISRVPRRSSTTSSKRPSVSSHKPSICSIPENPPRTSSDSDRPPRPQSIAQSARSTTGKRARHPSIAESNAESNVESNFESNVESNVESNSESNSSTTLSAINTSIKSSAQQPAPPQLTGAPIRSKRPSLMSRMKFKMTNNKDEFSQLIKNGGQYAVKCAIDKGASVHTENSAGQTGLITAAIHGHDDIITLLLEHGAVIDAMGHGGETALSVAAAKGYDDIVQLLLLRGADPNSGANFTGKTALAQGAALGHYNIVRILLNFGADANAICSSDDTALTHAAANDRYKVAQLLLERGAIPDKTGYTGKTPLWRAVNKGSVRMVRLLLDKGADPNRKDSRQCSPSVLAIQQGRTEILSVFYQYGYASAGERWAKTGAPPNGDLEHMRDGVSHRLSIFNN